jgi:hypothetical protein
LDKKQEQIINTCPICFKDYSILLFQFSLADPNLPVLVDLEVRFDIQLEGDSFILFSPELNPMDSVLVITHQWNVQAI